MRRPGKRGVFGLAIPLALTFWACSTPQSKEFSSESGARWNVILISIDNLRADRLGSAGYKRVVTPNLDLLGKGGHLFKNAYANAGSTLASHMSLFTGLYPKAHGILSPVSDSRREDKPIQELPRGVLTLPEYFQSAGYSSARFVHSRDFFLDASLGLGRGFDELYPFGLDTRYASRRIGEWIEDHKREPFFLFIHSKRAHAPFSLPLQYAKKFVDPKAPKNRILDTDTKLHAALEKDRLIDTGRVSIPGVIPDQFVFFESVNGRNPKEVEQVQALYDSAVFMADELLGEVLTRLNGSGLADHTLIFVTSDHGEEFMEHGRFFHRTVHEEILRVPMVVSLPKALREKMPAAEHIQRVQVVDVLPTILELSGISVRGQTSGKSLVPVLRGSKAAVHERVHAYDSLFRNPTWSTVIEGRWKLIRSTSDPRVSLFDLDRDPQESHNLAAQQASEVARLEKILDQIEKGTAQ